MGRLLGGEHASTHRIGVEAPRLLKRSLSRLYYCFVVVSVCASSECVTSTPTRATQEEPN